MRKKEGATKILSSISPSKLHLQERPLQTRQVIPFQVFCSSGFEALTLIKWFSLHDLLLSCFIPVMYQGKEKSFTDTEKNKIKSSQYFRFSQIDFGSSQVSDRSTMYEILSHMYILQISISLRITKPPCGPANLHHISSGQHYHTKYES